MCGHSRLDKIRNEVLRSKGGVTSIEDKMIEASCRWFVHIRRRSMDALQFEGIEVDLASRMSWNKMIRYDLRTLRLTEDMTQDRRLWKSS